MHILLTGGGTAGHVIPNLAIRDAILIASHRKRSASITFTYIGSKQGLERKLCLKEGLPFEAIQTGKFRRYWDLRNILDLFRIGIGIIQAIFKLLRLRPTVVFSKGGFVGFPVVFAAWLLRIPVVIHESDVNPGLATRLSAPFAKKILLAHEGTGPFLSHYKNKVEVTGNPIRLSLLKGKKLRGRRLTGFKGERPVVLVIGGSSGSAELNDRIRQEKKELTKHYDLIHLTGEGKGKRVKTKHYYALPFAGEEMKAFYAMASLAISRAGANTLAELEALQLPSLFFPLGTHASRGDQYANAKILIQKSPLFRMGDKKKSLAVQLAALPNRPRRFLENKNTEKIAIALLHEVQMNQRLSS